MKNIIDNLLAEPAMGDWTASGIYEDEATIEIGELIEVRFFRGSEQIRVRQWDKSQYLRADELILIGRAAQAASKL